MRYFFEITYDGSNYHGWQKQPNSNTIQQTIEDCMSTILKQKIDIVGAGDAVMANLALALASNASAVESMNIAMAAASIVVRQLGTTGVATCNDISSVFKNIDK